MKDALSSSQCMLSTLSRAYFSHTNLATDIVDNPRCMIVFHHSILFTLPYYYIVFVYQQSDLSRLLSLYHSIHIAHVAFATLRSSSALPEHPSEHKTPVDPFHQNATPSMLCSQSTKCMPVSRLKHRDSNCRIHLLCLVIPL